MTGAAKSLNSSEANRIEKWKISRNHKTRMKIKYQVPEYEKNERGNVKVDYKVSENGLD